MVTFWKLNEYGEPEYPVLYLDTLKVSTIEQTASTADATGGKGNAKLVSWDYGKEINVTLEDALFSPKSMSLMFGGGNSTVDTSARTLDKTINYLAKDASALPTKVIKNSDGEYEVVTQETTDDGALDVTWYAADGTKATGTPVAGERYIGHFKVAVAQGKGKTITVDAAHFPGTYRVVGDTYARNEANGNDELTWNSSLVA